MCVCGGVQSRAKLSTELFVDLLCQHPVDGQEEGTLGGRLYGGQGGTIRVESGLTGCREEQDGG